MVMQNKKVLNYNLLRLLGKGGMAEVWYAENKIGNVAAVKILNEDLSHNAQVVERFGNEARVTVRLKHPNIRQVYDYDEIDGRPCMVMEYLEGDDLSTRMKHGERFTDEQLQKWWTQLASALNYTHAQGVVHRDIKPSNIFIDREDNVKLLDFGIAKVRDSITSTATGATMGTLMYMSPEQVRDSKHIDYKTDLYSLAVSFVHLLAGHAPYDRDTTDDFEIRLNIVQNPLDLSGLPSEWQAFLRPYLAKKPEERPALVPFGAGQTGCFVPPVAPPSDETVVGGVNAPVYEDATVAETPVVPSQSQPKSQPQSRKRKAWPWIVMTVCAVLGIAVSIILLPGVKKGDGGNGSAGETETVAEVMQQETPTLEVAAPAIVEAEKPTKDEATPAVEESKPVPAGYVDLGLSVYWKTSNEYNSSDDHGFYTWDEAKKFGSRLPNKAQLEELRDKCKWTWNSTNEGYYVKGPSGNSIFLPAAGYRGCDGDVNYVGSYGNYWSSTPSGTEDAWDLYFSSGRHIVGNVNRCYGQSVRLVQGK